MVEKFTGIRVPTLAPIVGKNAFTHNAGLHVAAVLMDPTHYESIPVDLIGRTRRIAIDRMAGRPTIRFKLRELGINVTEPELDMVMGSVKGVGTRAVSDSMLRGFVRDAKRSLIMNRRQGPMGARRKKDSNGQDGKGDGWWNELCEH
jgi:isopropylmalate/homocitrate/citramalate synthase